MAAARLGVAVVALLTIVVNMAIGWGWPIALAAGFAVLVAGELTGLALSPRAAPELPQPAAPGSPYGPLSRRQVEVAVLVADGLTSKEVAARLYIEESTVERHLEHIYQRLGIHSRVELANWVRDHDLSGFRDRNREKLGKSPDS